MNIIDLSVKRPVAMSMLLLIVMAVGIFAAFTIPIDFLPDIESPIISVTTVYSGAGPEEVEVSVTRPLEEGLSTVENLLDITSTSQEGYSTISLEFEWGSDLDQAMFNIREALDMVTSRLPDDADSPRIFKFSSDMIPVIGISISGIDDMATAYDIADSQIATALDQIPGVGQVNIVGGTQTEVHIELNQNRLQAYNIDADTVASVVSANNVTAAGGYVYQGAYQFGVRTDGELKNLEDFRNIVITYVDNTPIFLRDLADVYYGGNEDNPLQFITGKGIIDESATQTGRPSVALFIVKSSGANTVEVGHLVQAKLDELKRTLPPGVEISEIMNTAKDIESSINNVRNSGLQGGLFALLVIFFYLWDWRALLVIGLSIPTSLITTFIAMYLFDVSFNTVAMTGLILAIGMMVDSSIVVLENIYRHRAEGDGKITASIKGAKEVGMAITASTLTTIAVFAPILFVGGMMGQLFRDLVITVVVGLLASLLISVTLVPMLCSILIKKVSMDGFDTDQDEAHYKAAKHRWNDRILHRVDMAYKAGLEWCVKHKKTTVFGGLGAVIVMLVLFLIFLPKEYMPVSDDGQLTVTLIFPQGTVTSYNEALTRNALGDIREYFGDDLEVMSAQVKATRGMFGAIRNNRSQLRIQLVSRDERDRDITQLANGVRQVLSRYPLEYRVSIGSGRGGGSSGEPITMQIREATTSTSSTTQPPRLSP